MVEVELWLIGKPKDNIEKLRVTEELEEPITQGS